MITLYFLHKMQKDVPRSLGVGKAVIPTYNSEVICEGRKNVNKYPKQVKEKMV